MAGCRATARLQRAQQKARLGLEDYIGRIGFVWKILSALLPICRCTDMHKRLSNAMICTAGDIREAVKGPACSVPRRPWLRFNKIVSSQSHGNHLEYAFGWHPVQQVCCPLTSFLSSTIGCKTRSLVLPAETKGIFTISIICNPLLVGAFRSD